MSSKKVLSRSLPVAARKFHVGVKTNASKPSSLIDSIIRVDHAGELGADRIYAGQMAVLGNTKMGPLIQHMWDQEKVHKATFEQLIIKHRVRPTMLVPVWNIAGFLLGAGTALMGEKAAMACTVAVESVIVDHYNDQLRTLMLEPNKNKELMETIQKFRDDEQEHHDCGIHHGAEQAPFYKALSEVIKFGCKTAIAMSKGLLSQRNHLNFTVSRTYCTSKDELHRKKWDLYSAVCLERKPRVLKPLTKLERKVAKHLFEIEVEKSCKSDHEMQLEEDLVRAEMLKKGSKNLDLNVILKQSAHEFEEISNKEFDSFLPASIITPMDKNNDLKSVNRELSNHLLFLINEKLGTEKYWMLPQGIIKEEETLRSAAERILQEKCGNKLQVLFLGNAPCGFYKYAYPRKMRKEVYGAKVFFLKALYISGEIELQNPSDKDYQWATRRDLIKLLERKYYKKVSMFLIEDEEVEREDEEEVQNNIKNVEVNLKQ